VLGALWIFFSDKMALMISSTPEVLTQIAIIKGWVYVFLTALLLYSLVSRGIEELELSQEALLRAKEDWERTFDAVPDLIAIIDKDYRIVRANKAMAAKLAVTQEACIGLTCYRAVHGMNGPPSFCPHRQLLANGIEYTTEVHEDCLGGDFVVSVSPLFDPIGKLVGSVHVARDITERKRAEEELRRSEEKYRLVVENAGEAILIAQGGMLRFANRRTSELFGYSEDILTTKPFIEFVHPEDREMVLHRHQKRLQGGEVAHVYPFRVVTDDGSVKWVEIHAAVVLWEEEPATLNFLNDITERKMSEEAIHGILDRFHTILSKLFVGILVVTENNQIEFANQSFCDHFHILESPSQLIGLSTEEMLAKILDVYADPAAALARIREIVAQGECVVEEEIPMSDERVLLRDFIPISIEGKKSGRLWQHRDMTERRRAEEKLKDSEQQMRSIIQGYPIPAFMIGKDHRVIYWNKALEELSGIGANEIAGTKGHWRAFHSGERPCMADLLVDETPELLYHWYNGKCSKSKLIEDAYEATDFFPDLGEGKWLHLTVAAIRNAQGTLVGAIETLNDITERKKAEKDLITANQQLNDIIEFLPDATFVIDSEGRVIAWNWAIEEMTGVSKKDMIGKGDHECTIPFYGVRRPHLLDLIGVSNEELESKYNSIQRKGNILSAQTYVPCVYGGKGAHVFATGAPLLDMHGNRVGAIESIRDITEYKEAEQALKESRQQLADIINFLPDATLVIDKDGRIIAWNRAMEAMTRVMAEEMIGKGNYEYSLPFYGTRRPILIDLALHPNHEMEEHYTTIQRRGDIVFGEAFTPSLPPGNVHLSATASVLRDSKGEVIAAIECIRDNTQRKRLEERLQRAEKMEALGTLAGGVAHDLNNVLGVLVGYSELLLDKIPKGDPLNKHVSHIMQSSNRAAAIIQDLLTLARRGVAISEIVNLNGVISDYFRTPEFERLKDYHPKVALRTDFEKDLLNIKGSPIHLGTTVMNLVSNATEAISGEGEVIIRTENRYLDKPIRGYEDMQEGDYAVLTVSDNGKGISDTDIEKIFEPFYTKKVMGRSGTGLGLAVVWGTVKDHDGYIDVQSEEGKGSTFTIYFPVSREQLSSEQQKMSPDQYMGSEESILVVDDVEGQRELAVSMLTRLGYRVHAVSSGVEAVAYIKSNTVDLLFLDMIMEPGIDGLETYRRVLEINPEQKAILVSGFSETDRVKEAQKLGAGAYVKKPYVLEKLGLAVRKELDRMTDLRARKRIN
jgi:two-component system, cell cycle sensor histidine kinase and response regulator CckA